MTSAQRSNVYERITADILAAIERGADTWRMPWHHDGSPAMRPVNVATGAPYRGLNILALWAAAEQAGYRRGLWGTYRCWAKLGAQVRKGERATLAVFWKRTDPTDASDDDEPSRPRMFARGFSLFNVDQVDNYTAPDAPALPETHRIMHADAFIAALNVHVVVGGDMAYYRPATDTVHLPPFACFKDAVSAVGVSLHEHAHASGAKHRLDRDLTGRFGTFAYAMEEAVAELTASFVLADLGLACDPRPDHAAYIASWLEALRSDPRAIFTAASKAQQAADWMHAMQPSQASAAA
ncbi:MAG TPA: zincin-like metallopeptidase domain-containing protein [Caulobacterales bacterium]|nr:zincin-like metallopeptidase domain-containing protein [Caulobacterales bacterium]